jgi:hypothetical protein
MRTETSPMNPREKVALTALVWWRFAGSYVRVKRQPLPHVMTQLHRTAPTSRPRVDARRLGRIVQRVLTIGPWHARCLWTAVVLYRLLREQGDDPDLVIGLPSEPKDKDAHAWIEIDGVDVGPPPGRTNHQELTRYG